MGYDKKRLTHRQQRSWRSTFYTMEAVSIKANLPARPAYKASKYIVPNQQVPCEMIQRPRPLVAGNWKMNGTRSSSHSWAKYMSRLAATKVLGCDIAVSPPAPLLDLVARALGATTTIALCGQDCAPQGYPSSQGSRRETAIAGGCGSSTATGHGCAGMGQAREGLEQCG